MAMPNCFHKQTGRYTHSMYTSESFFVPNLYTDLSSSICLCSLSCNLINHSPLYIHSRNVIYLFSSVYSLLETQRTYIYKQTVKCKDKQRAIAINNIEHSLFLYSDIDYLDYQTMYTFVSVYLIMPFKESDNNVFQNKTSIVKKNPALQHIVT